MYDNILLDRNICIRGINLDDMQQIRESVTGSAVFTESEVHDVLNMVEHYVRFPEKDELETYAYTIGEKIAGFVSFGLGLGNRTYELYWICVSPEYQGHGIGAKLLKFAENHIIGCGGRILFIETSTSDKYEKARAFYGRRGYEVSAIVRDYFDEGDDKLIYSKKLMSPKPSTCA